MTGSPNRQHQGEQRDRKAALRRSVRDARRTMAPEQRREGSDHICSRLRLLPELLTTRVVLVYAAANSEVDIEPAATELRRRGIRTFYPRVRGEELDLVPVTDTDPLVAGHRGIREPLGQPADPALVDAVVVPGIAFDLRGRRLGQGGGHYDRVLPRIGDALRVGVAFACQVVPRIPDEPHDIAMDVLITDRVVHRFDRAVGGT